MGAGGFNSQNSAVVEFTVLDEMLFTFNGGDVFNIDMDDDQANELSLDDDVFKIDMDLDTDDDPEFRLSKWDFMGHYASGGLSITAAVGLGGTTDRYKMFEYHIPVALYVDTVHVYIVTAFTDAGATGCAWSMYGKPAADGTAAQIVSAEGVDWTATGEKTHTLDQGDVWIPPGVYYASWSCDDTAPGAIAVSLGANAYFPEARMFSADFTAGEDPPATFDVNAATQGIGISYFFELYQTSTSTKTP